jgi:AcrR family transcriptional regulator
VPRRYTLGKRAGQKADTRARIVAAAVEIYRERGMSAASTLAVAHAADVAPATVRNHFPDRDAISTAVFDAVLAELQPPSERIFDGIDGIGPRLRRLAEAMADFYERSQPWWLAYEREPELFEAWSSRVERYNASMDAFMRAALGPLGDDDRALTVVAAIIGPPAFFNFRSRGLSSPEAVDLGLELTVPWLEARLAAATAAAPVSAAAPLPASTTAADQGDSGRKP